MHFLSHRNSIACHPHAILLQPTQYRSQKMKRIVRFYFPKQFRRETHYIPAPKQSQKYESIVNNRPNNTHRFHSHRSLLRRQSFSGPRLCVYRPVQLQRASVYPISSPSRLRPRALHANEKSFGEQRRSFNRKTWNNARADFRQ